MRLTTTLRRLRAAFPAELPVGLRVVKTGLACALAWLVASPLFTDSLPVFAPLAALFTVQVTVYRSVAVGLQRAAAVIVGVLAALLFAHVFGLHAWSIGVMTSAAMLIGQALRFGQQAVQVPVSALLVLALSGQSHLYPRDRVLETLLGGAIGVAVNLAVAPPLLTRVADLRLERLAATVAALLDDIATGLTRGWDHPTARGWLLRARRLHQDVDAAREALAQAEESVRYNPRRLTEVAETAHFQAALTALEHTSFQARGISRSLTDLAATDPGAAAAVGRDLGPVLAAAAEAMRAFGEAVGGHPEGVERLRAALGEARGRLEAAVAAAAAPAADGESPAWTIRGSLLADSARMLREIDPDTGHTRRRWVGPRADPTGTGHSQRSPREAPGWTPPTRPARAPRARPRRTPGRCPPSPDARLGSRLGPAPHSTGRTRPPSAGPPGPGRRRSRDPWSR